MVDLLTARYYCDLSTSKPAKPTVAEMNVLISQVFANAVVSTSAAVKHGLFSSETVGGSEVELEHAIRRRAGQRCSSQRRGGRAGRVG